MANSLKGKRIFIIEDNIRNKAIMQLLLEQQWAAVEFERWGKTVIERMERFKPIDVVLLDLMFPGGVSGFDIFDTIRDHPEFTKVPIVAVTASDPEEALPKVRSKGFSGYISKPIDFDSFTSSIAKVIDGQQVWLGSA